MTRFFSFFTPLFLFPIFAIQASNFENDYYAKMIDDSELNVSLIDISTVPSAIVGGVVNVVTGNYFESSCDLVMPGSNPIIVNRRCNNNHKEKGTLCHGWDLNFASKIEFSFDEDEKFRYGIANDRGANLLFKGTYTNKREVNLKLDSQLLRYGITNCANGVISGLNNIKNKRLSYEYKARHCELHEETGELLVYRRTSDKTKHLYLISKNYLPNGCRYEYHRDGKDRISSVNSLGMYGDTIAYLDWFYPEKFKSTPQLILSANGRSIKYQYDCWDYSESPRYFLTSVIRSFAPTIHYNYSDKRVTKKSLPNNRFTTFRYYVEGQNLVGSTEIKLKHKDARIDRISSVFSPVGNDDSPILTWRILYHLDKDHRSSKPIGGHAEVFDALDHRKKYFFSNEHRLHEVRDYLDNGKIYRRDLMNWGESGELKTFLLSRLLVDQNELIHVYKSYRYDDSGNVLKENMQGNLSGRDQANKAEIYEKYFSYTLKNLVQSVQDGRKKIVNQYGCNTNEITMKLIYNGNKIVERHNFAYNANSALVYEIIDDGDKSDINNLSNVTFRKIKKITPTKSIPVGLPHITEEFYLNLLTGQEERLNRTENIYSSEGLLIQQNVYDNQDKFCFAKKWEYDSHANIIQETDPLGHVTSYKYDQNNNCIFKQGPDLNFHTTYGYDFVNRLIKEENIYKDGRVLTLSYTYDYLGNRTSCTDIYGNTTHYRYDEFNRLIEKIYPSCVGVDGDFVQRSDKVSYDILNNPTEKTDTNGYTTKRSYTAWGKPYFIEHPDDTFEKLFYHLDGTLEKTIDANKVETVYTHDYKGRKTSEEKISPSGQRLAKHQWNYNAFHLISEINAAGHQTYYTYDGAGRLICVKRENFETRYAYDSLGRQTETWELYEPGKYRKTIKVYDNLNRVIHEKITDDCDTLYSSQSYRYDCNGNCTHVIIHDNQGDLFTITLYNSYNKPVKIIQPDGTEVHFIYHYDYKNALGQCVACTEEIDPNGNRCIKIMDTCGRLASEEKKDSSGKILQRTVYQHDGEGNLICRIDDVLIDGIYQKSIKSEFLYDSRNRIIAVIEAAGEPIQKVTRKEYHLTGQLAEIIKPDGITIFHQYDYLGRLIYQYSSDGSIDYVYTYDLNNNITSVKDCVTNTITNRSYDQNNMMISEELANGLKSTYQYDSRGRLKQVVLPDQSLIDYHYDAANLRSIERQKQDNTYKCEYQFNLSGKIAKINLPNQTINYSYDVCLRPKKIDCRNWSQEIPEGGYDFCGNVLQVKQIDCAGELVSFYAYDSLHHLISETGISNHTYRFDSIHNRLSKNEIIYNINSLNQLTGQGENVYEYDPNGNQSKKIASTNDATYQYDALDRMTSFITENKKIEYTYDAFHRRLKKTIFELQEEAWIEVNVITYLYQGDKEIGALNKNGQIFELRTLGVGNKGEIGAAVFIEINDEKFCPLHDFRGNVTALSLVSDGTLAECYRYTAYGEEHIFNKYGQEGTKARCPWRFSSKRIDAETGWVYFGRRYYDPEIGKWTTPDPLGFKDSANVYCFVRNRPLIYIDPDGRWLTEAYTTFADYLNYFFDYEHQANAYFCSCMRAYSGEDYEGVEFPFKNESCVCTVGTPVDDGIGICFVNGIFNSKDDAMESAKTISDMIGGREVHVVYNASFGYLDLFECSINLAFGAETRPAELIKETWTNFFNNGGQHFLIIGHSQGALHIRNAGSSSDQDLLQNIHVLGIAPAAHMQEDVFGTANHYESKRDFVPWFDRLLGGTLNSAPIHMLTPHPDAHWFDHGFDSPTYQQSLGKEIDGFIRMFGG